MQPGQLSDKNTSAGPTRSSPQRSGLGQRTCLDGIRGAAVLGVIVFHLDYAWAAGGYFSVDIFFVLSGFLITSLLLHEFLQVGHINLGGFWSRRARRLIPALLLTLAAVAILGKLTLPSQELGALRRDGLAALVYASNWVQASSGANYFDLFSSRSLLEHFWTLAIEEQFYLVWPFMAAALFAWSYRNRSDRRSTVQYGHPLIVVGVVGALASAAWMAYLYRTRGESIVGALYFRTDTRAHTILIGVAFAGIVARLGRVDDQRHREWWDRAGIAAALLILTIMAWQPSDGAKYQGVFLLVAILAGILIVSPMLAVDGRFNRALNNTTLRYCGTLSYGLYLWHWPVFQIVTPARTGLPWFLNDVLRLLVTFGLSEMSARFVEIPVRKGTFPAAGLRVGLLSVSAVAVLIYGATAGATLSDAERYARDRSLSDAPPVAVPKRTTAVVLGDSFGASLGTDWSKGTTATGEVSIINLADSVCSTASQCPGAVNGWVTAASDNDADVVVLAVTTWSTFGTFSGAYDPSGIAILQAYVTQVTEVVEQFRALGVPVVAVTPPADGAGGPSSILATQQVFEDSSQGTNGWLTVHLPPAATCSGESCTTSTTAAATPEATPTSSATTIATRPLPNAYLSSLEKVVREAHVDAATTSLQADARTRVLIVGDSVGWSLGAGWYDGSAKPPDDADVLVWNRGRLFCGIDEHPGYELTGDLRAKSSCADWRTDWAADVRKFDPDVVLLPMSLWTTFDRLIDGERVDWESDRYQQRLKSLYSEAGAVLSAQGAQVVYLSQAPSRDDRLSDRANQIQAERARSQSLLAAQIVSEHPDNYTFIDYSGFVCPDLACEEKVQGVNLRPDNLHLSTKGSAIVAEWLTPQLIALAEKSREAASANNDTTTSSTTTPGTTTTGATTTGASTSLPAQG